LNRPPSARPHRSVRSSARRHPQDLQLRKCNLPAMFSRLQMSSAAFSRSTAINQYNLAPPPRRAS
jgi:hypothetical protein